MPPLAQLKLLRAMQQEVNTRTEAFRKAHHDASKLGPKEKAELDDIRREQKEVGDLLKLLTQPAGDEPEDDEKPMAKKADKKDEVKP